MKTRLGLLPVIALFTLDAGAAPGAGPKDALAAALTSAYDAFLKPAFNGKSLDALKSDLNAAFQGMDKVLKDANVIAAKGKELFDKIPQWLRQAFQKKQGGSLDKDAEKHFRSLAAKPLSEAPARCSGATQK